MADTAKPVFSELLTFAEVSDFVKEFRTLPSSVPDARSCVRLSGVNLAVVERAIHVRNGELRSAACAQYSSFAQLSNGARFDDRHLGRLFDLRKRYEEPINQLEKIACLGIREDTTMNGTILYHTIVAELTALARSV